MFEVGNTYPTVDGEGKYTVLKIVEGLFPIHAYDYENGDFRAFTLEGRMQKATPSEMDLVPPMKIGQKLVDNEGDEWYVLPSNVVAAPKLEVFGEIEGDSIKWNDNYYTYRKA